MRIEIARMHAHVCGDGDIGIYTSRRGERDIARYNRRNLFMKTYKVRYTNNKTNLLEEFKEDARNAFDASGFIWRNECIIQNKKVFSALKSLGAGGSWSWLIPEEVFRSDEMVRAEWLRAFCDDESTVDIENRRVRIKSVNFSGICQTKTLFETIGINSRITGPNIDKTWYLTIPRPEIPRFAKLIKLKHKEKQMKIEKILSERKSDSPHHSSYNGFV